MKLHFGPNLDFQHAAIDPVCAFFKGQVNCRNVFTITRDIADHQPPALPERSKFRLRSDGLAGNTLTAHDHVIHMAIFKLEPTKPEPENMASVKHPRSRFMRE